MRKITPTEKRGIWFLVIGIALFTLISSPLEELLGNTFPNPTVRLGLGLGLAIFIAYIGKFKKYYSR